MTETDDKRVREIAVDEIGKQGRVCAARLEGLATSGQVLEIKGLLGQALERLGDHHSTLYGDGTRSRPGVNMLAHDNEKRSTANERRISRIQALAVTTVAGIGMLLFKNLIGWLWAAMVK